MQGNENAAFGEGRLGIILLRVGGQLELKNADEVQINEDGISIRHNDPGETLTFVPWSNVAWVRTYNPHPKRRIPTYDAEEQMLQDAVINSAVRREKLHKELDK